MTRSLPIRPVPPPIALAAGRAPGLRLRLARDLSAILIGIAVLLALDVLATLVWQEPVTAVVAALDRAGAAPAPARISLSGLDRRALAGLETASQRIAFLARREQARLRGGDAVGRLAIPRIGLDMTFVQGTAGPQLELGPGHYPSTGLPGQGETIAIAGHRTTFLEPFRHIDELRRGDLIEVRMPYGSFAYAVTGRQVVAPDALWVTRNLAGERLVLSACTPLFSAAKRIIIFASLQRELPAPAS